MDATGPNAEQIKYWNEQTGPKWVAEQTRLDAMIAPFGEAALAALAPRPGERVIDVGCGCGETSLALAARVTTTGSVLGIDISEPMVGRARERAVQAGLDHVRFVVADAQTHPLPEASADAAFSRFGVMFFADPTAAFTNIGGALVPGGRIAFVCWQAVPENPWMLVPLMALASVLPLPPPPAPEAPGPFALADPVRVRGILEGAHLRDVRMEPFTPQVTFGGGGSLEDAVAFALQVGPTSALLRDAPPDTVARAAAAVRDALAPYATDRGVALASAAWIVTARR